MPFYGESFDLKEISTEAEVNFASRRLLKKFIINRGLRYDDCVGMDALRDRAREAFTAPRYSRVDTTTAVQKIKRMEAEKRKHKAQQTKKLEQEKKKTETLAKAKLITRNKALVRSQSSSDRTLRTDDEIAERRHINFDPKRGKLGMVLQKSTCTVEGIRENSQAYWAGVKAGWVIQKVDGASVDSTSVRPALKQCVTGRQKYGIDFATYFEREKQALPDQNPPAVQHFPTRSSVSFKGSQDDIRAALGIVDERKESVSELETEAPTPHEVIEPRGEPTPEAFQIQREATPEIAPKEATPEIEPKEATPEVVAKDATPEPEQKAEEPALMVASSEDVTMQEVEPKIEEDAIVEQRGSMHREQSTEQVIPEPEPEVEDALDLEPAEEPLEPAALEPEPETEDLMPEPEVTEPEASLPVLSPRQSVEQVQQEEVADKTGESMNLYGADLEAY